MPIRTFLSDQAFDPEVITAMSLALERVCDALRLKAIDDIATRLDDRFHETHPIGCHHSSLVSLASRSYILVIRSWSAYDSNHGSARLVAEKIIALAQCGIRDAETLASLVLKDFQPGSD